MALTPRGLQYLLPTDPPDLAAVTKTNAFNLDTFRGQVDDSLAAITSGGTAVRHRAFTWAQASRATGVSRVTLVPSAYDRPAGAGMTLTSGAVSIDSGGAGVYLLHATARFGSGLSPLPRVNGLGIAYNTTTTAGGMSVLSAVLLLAAADVVELVINNSNGAAADWPNAATVTTRQANFGPDAALTLTRLGA